MTNITRNIARGVALLSLSLLATQALAQDLSLPSGASPTREYAQSQGAYDLPMGPWTAQGGLPVRRFEGNVSVQSWRIEASGLTPLQVVAPLRDQLAEAGYEIILDCLSQACGGFDYRFSTLVLPAPEMFVDLTDFQALTAISPEAGAISLLASRDATSAYLQIIRVGAGASAGEVKTDAPALVTATPGTLSAQLEGQGFAILHDLVFETGSSSLGDGSVGSLDEIADYLQTNPGRRILFVGHTDAVGSLEGNQSLSRKRAASAVAYLRARHNIPEAQIGADGVGYLSPIASNLTAEGREANRRVEAVLISTE